MNEIAEFLVDYVNRMTMYVGDGEIDLTTCVSWVLWGFRHVNHGCEQKS